MAETNSGDFLPPINPETPSLKETTVPKEFSMLFGSAIEKMFSSQLPILEEKITNFKDDFFYPELQNNLTELQKLAKFPTHELIIVGEGVNAKLKFGAEYSESLSLVKQSHTITGLMAKELGVAIEDFIINRSNALPFVEMAEVIDKRKNIRTSEERKMASQAVNEVAEYFRNATSQNIRDCEEMTVSQDEEGNITITGKKIIDGVLTDVVIYPLPPQDTQAQAQQES